MSNSGFSLSLAGITTQKRLRASSKWSNTKLARTLPVRCRCAVRAEWMKSFVALYQQVMKTTCLSFMI